MRPKIKQAGPVSARGVLCRTVAAQFTHFSANSHLQFRTLCSHFALGGEHSFTGDPPRLTFLAAHVLEYPKNSRACDMSSLCVGSIELQINVSRSSRGPGQMAKHTARSVKEATRGSAGTRPTATAEWRSKFAPSEYLRLSG